MKMHFMLPSGPEMRDSPPFGGENYAVGLESMVKIAMSACPPYVELSFVSNMINKFDMILFFINIRITNFEEKGLTTQWSSNKKT